MSIFQEARKLHRAKFGRNDESEKGMTLIELVGVIVIVGILIAAAVGYILSTINSGHQAGGNSDLSAIATAQSQYITTGGGANNDGTQTYGTLSYTKATGVSDDSTLSTDKASNYQPSSDVLAEKSSGNSNGWMACVKNKDGSLAYRTSLNTKIYTGTTAAADAAKAAGSSIPAVNCSN